MLAGGEHPTTNNNVNGYAMLMVMSVSMLLHTLALPFLWLSCFPSRSQPFAILCSSSFRIYIYMLESTSGDLGGSKKLEMVEIHCAARLQTKRVEYHGSRIIATTGCRRRRRQTVAAK
jgi:hypothetical protein